MKKDVICFKTHMFNKRIIRAYKKLAAECRSAMCDVVILYENSRKDFKSFEAGDRYFLFDSDGLKMMGYSTHEKLDIWYNGDYSLLSFYRQNPDYQYYWMIEYDVFFKGHWGLFFGAFGRDDSDLLGTYVGSPKQEPQYGAWGQHNLEVESENQRCAFFPVTRFSNRALKLLDEQYKLGKWGYCEVVGPTLLNSQGYKVSDLGATFYDRKHFRAKGKFPPGPIFLLPKNKLYHPVGRNYFIEFIKQLLPEGFKKSLKTIWGQK